MSKEITITSDYDRAEAQYDLDSLFRYTTTAPFSLPAKVKLYACVMGENNGADWYWILEVDGKYYYATGGCDYTGWNCQSSGNIEEVPSVEAAVEESPEVEQYYDRPIRKWLKAQVAGEFPVGVVDAV